MAKPDYERPVTGPTYPDEYIEFWARVYLTNRAIRARKVLFSTFLIAPSEILRAISVTAAPDALLLAQQRVARDHLEVAARFERLDELEASGSCCQNGRFIEKLRHHRHPRGAPRRAPKVVA